MTGWRADQRPTTACPNASCTALVQRHGDAVLPCCEPCRAEVAYAETRGLVPRRIECDEHSAKCRENQARRGAVLAQVPGVLVSPDGHAVVDLGAEFGDRHWCETFAVCPDGLRVVVYSDAEVEGWPRYGEPVIEP